MPWALDSGGFTELSLHGRWKATPAAYVAAVRRYPAPAVLEIRVRSRPQSLTQNELVQPLRVIPGDATSPQATGTKIIAHVCNDLGGWGKGFVLAVSRRWPAPEREYRAWYRERAHNDFDLGAVQLVQVQRDIWVANMVAQHGMRTGSAGPPIRYEALERCLGAVAGHAGRLEASVHMPRIGCGLAGGKWEHIEPIITRTLCERDIATTVYDFD
jgi:O-acetyl-ADP-ribose deacetylase (regulator of RNase III)